MAEERKHAHEMSVLNAIIEKLKEQHGVDEDEAKTMLYKMSKAVKENEDNAHAIAEKELENEKQESDVIDKMHNALGDKEESEKQTEEMGNLAEALTRMVDNLDEAKKDEAEIKDELQEEVETEKRLGKGVAGTVSDIGEAQKEIHALKDEAKEEAEQIARKQSSIARDQKPAEKDFWDEDD